MKIRHFPFIFMVALAAQAAQAAAPQKFPAAAIAKPTPSAEFQRAEALRKEKIQLDAALARHNAKMKALEVGAKQK